MKWLLGILLVVGFVQSLLDLFKDSDQSPSKKRITSILSILFIITLIAGITAMIISENEQDYLNKLTENTAKKVYEIDELSNKQLFILNYNIRKTEEIINVIDSLSERTSNLMKNEESLLKQYESVNSKLRKQIELERSQLKEREAIIELSDIDVVWEASKDSSTFSIRACVSNIGKRVAEIEKGNGFVLFFDANNQPFNSLKIPGNKLNNKLEPHSVKGQFYCYNSYGFKANLKDIEKITNFAILRLDVVYKDILLSKKVKKGFYLVWKPGQGFGGPKDWERLLAEKWANKNYINH